MFCTKCGKQLPDGLKFCTGCGNPVPRASQVMNQKMNNQPYYTNQHTYQNPRKKGKGLLIAVIAIASVLIIGIVVFFVINGLNDKNPTGTPATGNEPVSSVSMNESTIPSSSEVTSSSIAVESSTQSDESKEFVLEYSSTKLISESELEKLNAQELRIARNEIYARHGRKFKDVDLQNYFNSKSWYRGTVEPDKFNDNSLSEIEKKNRDLIQKYEDRNK